MNDGSINSVPIVHVPFPSIICRAAIPRLDLTTMAPLGTGRFIITHSKFKNVAYLADANSSSDLHGDWRQNRPGERVKYSLLYNNTQTDHLIQWNVVLLSNGNYTIKNSGHSSYATCEFIARPDVGNNIVGGDHEQQWKIVEDHANSYVCVYVCDYDHLFRLIHTLDVNVGFAPLRTDMYIGISPMGKVVLLSVTIF